MSLLDEKQHPKKYKCDSCGKVEAWNSNWRWYGSIFSVDNGETPDHFCSTRCAKSKHPSADII